MRLSYSSMAPIILNLIQWMDCSCSLSYTLPSYLGLLEVLVYKVILHSSSILLQVLQFMSWVSSPEKQICSVITMFIHDLV
jgi:hypothetical protein